MTCEIHPFPPLYSKNTRVLILGSFPSVKSREEKFFYGHPQNRFWRVLAEVFKTDVPVTIEEKTELILKNGLGLWDVIGRCLISGSADSTIKEVVPNDLSPILSECKISGIFVNGKTAEKYYNRLILPKTGMPAVCLPSTSPANAAWTLDRLISEWKRINLIV